MRDNLGRFVKGAHWRPRRPHWDKDWLVEQYVARGRSTGDLAQECDCTDANIIHWLKRHGIARRSISEARRLKHWGASGSANPMFGKTGAANPRYVDGSSPERQRLYAQGAGTEFIRDVLKRDAYRCRRCGAEKAGSKSLHVHHIRAWAGNESLRLDRDNAVTLCLPCHSWVHSKQNESREWLA